jgi:hypothetical protein
MPSHFSSKICVTQCATIEVFSTACTVEWKGCELPLAVRIVAHNADHSVLWSVTVTGDPPVYVFAQPLTATQYLRVYAQFFAGGRFVEAQVTPSPTVDYWQGCIENEQWDAYSHLLVTLASTDIRRASWLSGEPAPGYDWLYDGCFIKFNGSYMVEKVAGPRFLEVFPINNCDPSEMGNCFEYNPVFAVNEFVYHVRDLFFNIQPYGCPLLFQVRLNINYPLDCPGLGIPSRLGSLMLAQSTIDPANFDSASDYIEAGGGQRLNAGSTYFPIGACDLSRLNVIDDLYWFNLEPWSDPILGPGPTQWVPVSGKCSLTYAGVNV